MKKSVVYGTAVLALSAAPLFAQQPTTRPAPQGTTATQPGTRSDAAGVKDDSAVAKTSMMDKADQAFVKDAAAGSMAEVELGRLAEQKAASAAVKQFAQRMVTDHGKAEDDVKALAQNKGLTLPTDVGTKHKATKERLSALSGAAFDRAYMQAMVADHRADVASFRKMSLSAKDADVKAWAAKTLPTLEEHLTMAQEASRGAAVGTSGTSSASPTDKGTGVKPEPTTPPAGGTTDTPGGTMVRPGGSEPTGQPAPGGGASGIGSPR